jgi:hypothetical protein
MEFIAAIESAGPGATKYVQGHLTPLDGDVTKLEVRLGDKGYDAVVEEAPVTPERAQAPATSKPTFPSAPM